MNKEILLLATSLSDQKELSEDVVFSALEAALASVAARRYDEEVLMRVSIDRNTGDYETFRCWEVVESNDEFDTGMELPDQQMTVEQASEFADDITVGSMVEEAVESIAFGRIEAQQAKQVLIQKVREAERAKTAERYQDQMGVLLSGTVKRVTREMVLLDMGNNAEAILLRDEMMPRDIFRLNDRVRVVLYDIAQDRKGPQLMVSRTRSELLVALFKIEVPEIGEEVIEIMGAARDPGARSKIAVKTNDGRIDPVGACVGMRGARVQAVSNELSGERVDIVLWDQSPAQFVINAMAPAEVASIMVDEEAHVIDVIVEEDQLAQAIGRGGQNIRMASDLTGWRLNVMSPQQAEEKEQDAILSIKAYFIDELAIDDNIAEELAVEGFTTLDEVAYVSADELLDIDAFDEEMVTQLQEKAKQRINEKAQRGVTLPSEELLALEGLTEELASSLAEQGVVTLDGLAEQSVDELVELIKIDEQIAGDLIMKARAHWFESSEEK